MKARLIILVLVVLAAPALARPRTGRTCRAQDWKLPATWPSVVKVDPRAEFLIPVNVVRIYSDLHSAEHIAPKKWLNAQFQIANWLYALPEDQMRTYTGTRKAPCMQFRINRIFDVHEKDVSAALGFSFDTEKVAGGGQQKHNGPRVSSTIDLRQLKVTGGQEYLTVFCVWSLKHPTHLTQELGGESNIGFAGAMPTGPRRVLSRVTSTRARMGVVTSRRDNSWMNTVAHEFGHYFGLWHAWQRTKNHARGLRDLGEGPRGKVDPHKDWANVMDYDVGPTVRLYFARSQLEYMHRFTRDKMVSQIQVIRQVGATTRPPDVVVRAPKASITRILVAANTPGGPITVKGNFSIQNAKGMQGQFVVWFADGKGQKLKDTDRQYRSVDGQVSLAATVKPGFDAAGYKNFVATLPAGQLHLGPGTYTLRANAGLFFGGKLLASSKIETFSYTVPGHKPPPANKVAAWISNIRTDAGIMDNGTRSVKVTSKIVVHNLVGEDISVQVRYYLRDGRQLKDFDSKYRSSRGMVLSKRTDRPKFPRTVFDKFAVWIPEAQLHLVKGRWPIYVMVSVVHAGRTLATGTSKVFHVGKASAATKTTRAEIAKASVLKVWTTRNEKLGNQAGLKVRCDVNVHGQKGKRIKIIAWFWTRAAKPLRDFNGAYRSADGQVTATLTVTPLYPSTKFTDAAIFMPYSELHLVKGTHELGVTVGIFTANNKRIGAENEMTLFRVTQR